MRLSRQLNARSVINTIIEPLYNVVQQSNYVRDASYSARTGIITFKYATRRVQYSVTKHTLVVRNRINYTVYNNVSVEEFMGNFRARDPNTVFLIKPKEKSDGELRTTSA